MDLICGSCLSKVCQSGRACRNRSRRRGNVSIKPISIQMKITLSKFEVIIFDALVKSIRATIALDRQNKSKTPFTQRERIGNFTTYLRREVHYLMDDTSDKWNLRGFLNRIVKTTYWLDIAVPDEFGCYGYFRDAFHLLGDDYKTVIMDGTKMKSLCDLARETVELEVKAGYIIANSTSATNSSPLFHQDDFAKKLADIITSANAQVKAVQDINTKAEPIVSSLKEMADSLSE